MSNNVVEIKEKQSKKPEFTVGQMLSGKNFPPHPVYGPRRDLKITAVSETTGRWTDGQITCKCGNTRDIHSGDWFQVVQCEDCKSQERKSRRNEANREKREAREAKQAEKKAAREAKKTERKAAAMAKKTAKAASKKPAQPTTH